MTWVNNHIDGFMAWVQSSEFERDYSVHTLRAMRNAVNGFAAFAKENEVLSPKEVNVAVIRQYRRMLANNGQPSTVTHRTSLMGFFFDYLVSLAEIEANPVTAFLEVNKAQVRRGGRSQSRLPSILMLHEQDELIRYLFQREHFSSPRNVALVGLLLDSGLRVSECIGLTMRHGRSLLVTGTVRVIGKGNKERQVRPMKNYAKHWQDWIQSRDSAPATAPIFPSKLTGNTPMSQAAVHHIISQALIHAGIHATQRGPHLLRHSAASRMLHEGRTLKEVQHEMGHDSIVTTEQYLHLISRHEVA